MLALATKSYQEFYISLKQKLSNYEGLIISLILVFEFSSSEWCGEENISGGNLSTFF
jgi:hypothetical protein